jgi:UDP-glucose 4-epimerase
LKDFNSLKKVLVTGGAGYIGSHTCVELCAAGYEPVIIDNLCNSNPLVLTRLTQICGRTIPFFEGDVRDRSLLQRVFSTNQFDSVIHFAGLKSVGESVAKPSLYYDVNIGSASVLLSEMASAGVKNLVFSSSATVYDATEPCPIMESASLSPGNPYGSTKRFIERMLEEQSVAEPDWQLTALRYFNPVGAHLSGLIGEHPRGIPSNLMPYITQVAVGKRERLSVFGNDYDTVDGTGVRDYIHVTDLALGHVAALACPRTGFRTINLGTGHGTSVLQLIEGFTAASGCVIPYQILPRRPGDAATSFADASLAHRELNWRAERDIVAMCRDAWRWQSQNPNGYDV